MQRLHPRIRLVWLLQAAVASAIVTGLVAIANRFYLGGGPLIPVGTFIALFAVAAVYSVLRYRVWRYEVRDDELYLQRGVLTRIKTLVPFVRIQHVDSRRGPIERLTGLATTVVYTAGTRGADVTIPGLTPSGAESLQRQLKELAAAEDGDDAV